MALYTGTGDDGETGLFGKRRVPKDDARIEAYGTIDELNCHLGVVRSAGLDAEFDAALATIQSALFDASADLATEGGTASVPRVVALIGQLEQWTDASEAELTPLRSFVLPGGTATASHLHVARALGVPLRAKPCEFCIHVLARAERVVNLDEALNLGEVLAQRVA